MSKNPPPLPSAKKKSSEVPIKQKYQAKVGLFNEDNKRIYEEIKTQSNDRAMAIVAVGFIELTLAGLIEAKLSGISKKTLSGDDIAVIFAGLGPLHTFDLKIKFANAIGIIPEEMARELDYTRKIRNDFAHEIRHISFSESRIANLCANLKSGKQIEGAREQFLKATQTLLYILSMLSARHFGALVNGPNHSDVNILDGLISEAMGGIEGIYLPHPISSPR